MLLIKNATVYAPEPLGVKDIFLAGGKICAIRDSIAPGPDLPVEVVDGTGQLLLPGFIDSHVHILGGGGEGGYRSRTPELKLSDMIRAGTTTVVGCLGTDGITRRMENLIAKAKQLKDEGVSCYIYTGSYDVPVRTFLADIRSDLLFIDEVIGVGEIAIADHRSSQPTFEEFVRIVADTRVGGMLSGKGGVVNIHMGDDGQMLEYLERVKVETPLPAYHMIPTHMNRNPLLFERGITYAKGGGYVDFTTSSYASFQEDGELKSSDGLKKMLDAGVPIEHITFSSDGQGSLPVFNREGENIDVQVARVDTLYQEVRDAVRQENIPLETALRTITSNVADHLRLSHKGRVREGNDADLVLADPDTLEIQTVIARGQIMLRDGELLVKGSFE
ncbi:MAG: beta-aspartyl-peptidase [Lawsonibacter sp.]|jgi:beta-aspartyl-dipeptidase (metallo-type)|nr:beta-aspartyl-peptidase [Lawsonibacter sp.]